MDGWVGVWTEYQKCPSIFFILHGYIDHAVLFFLPEKKKIQPEKIFNILPENFSNCPRKKPWKQPEKKKCTREKKLKILPEKKRNLPEKQMQNSARENSKSTREKIRSKISNMNFFYPISRLWRAYVMVIFPQFV